MQQAYDWQAVPLQRVDHMLDPNGIDQGEVSKHVEMIVVFVSIMHTNTFRVFPYISNHLWDKYFALNRQTHILLCKKTTLDWLHFELDVKTIV